MPISDHIGGFIRPGYNPLLVTDAPTIGTASESGTGISTPFTAPTDVGGGAITSYTATAKNTSSGALTVATGTSSPITVTGLTAGQTYTVTVSATNAYGPSGASAASNSITMFNGGQLWLWGRNGSGQLGQGNTTDYSSPVQVGALTTWKTVGGTQSDATLAVKADGTAWSWGDGGSGQLGHNNTTSLSSPVQIGALTNWLKFAAGYYMGHAIKTDGTLWTTGGRNDNYGQLGTNNLTNYSSPVQIGALTTWSKLAVGRDHTLALKTDGTVWAWGRNRYGQLGDGSTTNRSSPVQVGALTTWRATMLTTEYMGGIKN